MSARPLGAWSIPAALLAYALLLLVTSMMRLVEIAGGPIPTPDNARFLVAPWAIYFHAGGGMAFLFLGAFQFSPELRARWPRWHRVSGRIAILGGVLSALASLYMTETFPETPFNPHEIYGLRILFGLVWLSCLTLGVLAAMRRDIAAHRGWLMRAYAIGLGGSTTAILLGSWLLLFGTPSPKVFALATGSAWIINLLVVERWITPKVRFSRAKQPAMLTQAAGRLLSNW